MNDETGFRQFVNARWPSLVQSAYLITLDGGIAEDCVQEALTRVHRRWSKVEVDNPEGYVRRAVVNAALSWRRKRRLREVPLEHAGSPVADEPVPLSLADADARLVVALRSLPPPQMRAAVVLRYLEDRSEAETAHLLGCSVGAVKSATSRGVAKLRAALGIDADDLGRPPRPPSLTAELIDPEDRRPQAFGSVEGAR